MARGEERFDSGTCFWGTLRIGIVSTGAVHSVPDSPQQESGEKDRRANPWLATLNQAQNTLSGFLHLRVKISQELAKLRNRRFGVRPKNSQRAACHATQLHVIGLQ